MKFWHKRTLVPTPKAGRHSFSVVAISRRIKMRRLLVISGKLLVLVLVLFILCDRAFAAEKLMRIAENVYALWARYLRLRVMRALIY